MPDGSCARKELRSWQHPFLSPALGWHWFLRALRSRRKVLPNISALLPGQLSALVPGLLPAKAYVISGPWSWLVSLYRDWFWRPAILMKWEKCSKGTDLLSYSQLITSHISEPCSKVLRCGWAWAVNRSPGKKCRKPAQLIWSSVCSCSSSPCLCGFSGKRLSLRLLRWAEPCCTHSWPSLSKFIAVILKKSQKSLPMAFLVCESQKRRSEGISRDYLVYPIPQSRTNSACFLHNRWVSDLFLKASPDRNSQLRSLVLAVNHQDMHGAVCTAALWSHFLTYLQWIQSTSCSLPIYRCFLCSWRPLLCLLLMPHVCTEKDFFLVLWW